MAAEKRRFSEERAIPLPPDQLKRLAQRLGMVPSISEGINVELEFFSDFLSTENRVLQKKLAVKEEEVKILRDQIPERDRESREKDQRIAQLEQEIENLRSSQPALPPAASEKPVLPEEGVGKENRPPSKNSRLKEIFDSLFGRKPTAKERSELIHYLDQLQQTPEGLAIAREITQILMREEIEKEERRANLQERARNLRRWVAHGISTFLVLGSLLAGSKASVLPSAKEKDEKLAQSPTSQTLYRAPEPIPKVEEGELSVPPPAVEFLKPRPERTLPKSSIEVVIPKKGWFWKSAEPLVANWLTASGYTNWVNEENGVRLSDVITKILVEELGAEGVDFQRLSPGYRFKIDLAGNGKVVKAAQSGSYEQYRQQQVNR